MHFITKMILTLSIPHIISYITYRMQKKIDVGIEMVNVSCFTLYYSKFHFFSNDKNNSCVLRFRKNLFSLLVS